MRVAWAGDTSFWFCLVGICVKRSEDVQNTRSVSTRGLHGLELREVLEQVDRFNSLSDLVDSSMRRFRLNSEFASSESDFVS